MTQRFIAGIGRANYVEVEDQLARDLIAVGAHDEVRLLHDLKVTLDAAAVEADNSWHRERASIADRAGRQGSLL
jgi:hypothetical protein